MEYVAEILVFAVFAMSLNLLLGYAGQVSVAHAAFGAFGGYAFATIVLKAEGPPWVAVLGAIVVAAVAGVLVGLPALRLNEEYLILLTLAVQTIVVTFVSASPDYGGPYGIPLANLDFFGISLSQPVSFVPGFIVIALIVGVLCWRIGESPFGRVLKGIREDELLTRSLGKHIYASKLIIFTVAAGFAGLAGSMLVILSSVATPSLFSFDQSVAILAMVVIGGRANLFGAVLGSALLVVLTPLLKAVLGLPPQQASYARMIVFGLVLLIVVWVRPQGIVPERSGKTRVAGGKRTAPQAAADGLVVATGGAKSVLPNEGDELVRIEGLSKSFGGIRAASDLNFALKRHQITALIGPNGAGKSTVFNLLTGQIRPDAGRVFLGEEDITGRSPDAIARKGMVRSFQHVRLIGRLSALQNVMLAIPGQEGERFGRLWVPGRRVRTGELAAREEASKWLNFVGLGDLAEVAASQLSFGDQKLLSLARTLATGADVLLLDEPASGIEGAWVDRMLELIQRACDEGRTVCIVEHNLDLVRRIADHVIFLELGEITAEGSYDELISNPRLVEAYFGTQ